MWAELFCLLLQLPDGGFRDRSEARELASDAVRQAAPPLPRFPATRVAPPPPAHARSRRDPLGVVGEPAAGRIPSGPSVGGWSRLGASSRPHIGRWEWYGGSLGSLGGDLLLLAQAATARRRNYPPAAARAAVCHYPSEFGMHIS
jgi:hypothetical protein